MLNLPTQSNDTLSTYVENGNEEFRVITEFRVQCASEIAQKLAAAVEAAEHKAYYDRTGVRGGHTPWFDGFPVALSNVVPFGAPI